MKNLKNYFASVFFFLFLFMVFQTKEFPVIASGVDIIIIEERPICSHGWEMVNKVITINPGCTTNGEAIYTCTVCGTSRTTTLSAKGHNFERETIITEETCTSAGEKICTCVNCGETKTVITPATGHSSSISVRTPSTCSTAGVRTYVCSSCNQTISEPLPLDPYRHEETEVRNAVSATCITEGYTGDTYCKSCGVPMSLS